MKHLFLLLILAVVTACAAIPELNVKYRLQQRTSDGLEGRRVSLAVEDARSSKTIMGPGARSEFRGFGGNLTLSVARPNDAGFMIGLFEPAALLKEGFKKRLANLGMEVDGKGGPGVPELRLVLKEFSLDLIGRNWVAKIGYEAKLLRDGEMLTAQNVNGRSERLRLFGRKGSDEVVGEIFTDVVNRLNVAGMFDQAQAASPAIIGDKGRGVVVEDLKSYRP